MSKFLADQDDTSLRLVLANVPSPVFAVIGMPKVGKSLLLEALSHFRFFPRGVATVTRMKLEVLLLTTCSQRLDDMWEDEMAKKGGSKLHGPTPARLIHFSVLKDNKELSQYSRYVDAEEVEQLVQSATTTITGDRGVDQIHSLKISVYDPNVITATLIDLPGIVQFETNAGELPCWAFNWL